jgi:hypothetical protein
VPNGIALNWTMQGQIKTCIAKPSREICALIRYFAALSGNSVLTFGDQEIQKREQGMANVTLHGLLFGGLSHRLIL